jgi:hypothetical protein
VDGKANREAFPWDSAPRYLLHDRDSIWTGRCHIKLSAK